MIEMKQTGAREVTLWVDGALAGGAAWAWDALSWGREQVTVARLTRLEARDRDLGDLWAYLEYLWQPLAVAAVQTPDGSLRWFHKALEASWVRAGSPGFSEAAP